MSWRPFVVTGVFVMVLVANMLLLWQEKFPSAVGNIEAEQGIEELRKVQYITGARRANFTEYMGMSDELADKTARQISRYQGQRSQLAELMQKQAPLVGDALCPGRGVPPPYSAMQLIVEEQNGIRSVLGIGSMIRFTKQPWYAKAPIEGVYNEMETGPNRQPDATLMGVSALLLGLENDAIEQRAPFGRILIGTRFDRLKRDSKTAKIEAMAIEYFSLMHFLAEIANDDSVGICL